MSNSVQTEQPSIMTTSTSSLNDAAAIEAQSFLKPGASARMSKDRLVTIVFLVALFHVIVITGVTFVVPFLQPNTLAPTLEVLLGFAPASLLHHLSFADVLNEDSGRGYQRRINPQHSVDFRRYIQQSGSSTIPLTFNLRPAPSGAWHIRKESGHDYVATLEISSDQKVLAQVDCQHRLGHMADALSHSRIFRDTASGR